MKRWALRIIVFLLLGAIVNVAVAWRYSLRWGLPDKPMTSTGTQDRSSMQADLFGVTLAERNLQTGSWESETWSVLQETHAGLPLRALHGSRTLSYGTAVEHKWYWLVPYGPIWPGFAINTVFYAFVLWLLFAAPFALRRRRRIKRGLCPKCAYDLRGTPSGVACPECGSIVAS